MEGLKSCFDQNVIFLDFKAKTPGISVTKLVERFNIAIGKTQAATIVKK